MRTCVIVCVVIATLLANGLPVSRARDCPGADIDRGIDQSSTTRFQISIPAAGSGLTVVDRMRLFYMNCTRIFGTLVINGLTDSDDASFLNTIEEVYGYVDIYKNLATNISLPKLRIIRGQQLLFNKYALAINSNAGLQYFKAPQLRSIELGTVYITASSPQLRCSNKIGWSDMMAGRPITNITTGLESNPCTCDSSCNGKCFGPGLGECYKNTYLGCSAIQCGKRCNLTSSFCCHAQCAGGCSGRGDTHCVSCVGKRDVLANGDVRCVASCPALTRLDAQFREVANPAGRYNYKLDCVRNCSDVGQYTYKQDCVSLCPLLTEPDSTGSCQPCGHFCKRICLGTNHNSASYLDGTYLQNNMTKCTIIQGDLRISSSSFLHQHTRNVTVLKPDDPLLDNLLSVEEITGCLLLPNANLTDLSFLRNVRKLGRCTPGAGGIANFSLASYGATNPLVYLGMSGLRETAGKVLLGGKSTCYVDTLNKWRSIVMFGNFTTAFFNTGKANCTGLGCSALCSDDGCLGPSGRDCYGCRNVSFDGSCYSDCEDARMKTNETRGVYVDGVTKECRICDPLCFPHGCTGPSNLECLQCPSLKLGASCVDSCPAGSYQSGTTCLLCSSVCQAPGSSTPSCTGPGTQLGPGGCSECTVAIFSGAPIQLETCVAQCPKATTFNNGTFNGDGVQVCLRCHPQCMGGCIGAASTECTSCRNSQRAGTTSTNCVQSCNSLTEFTGAGNECLPCHAECLGGCSAATADDCAGCARAYRRLPTGGRQCLAECPASPGFYAEVDGGLTECLDECNATMYNNTLGRCLPCSGQCRLSCVDGGFSVRSCGGACANFYQEGNCVQQCGVGFGADEESKECAGQSLEGPDNAEEQKSASTTGVVAGSAVGGVVVVVLVLLVVAFAMKRFKQKEQLKSEFEMEIPGMENPNYAVPSQTIIDSEMLHASPAQADPNMARLVLAQESEVKTGKELGEGAFGTVYEGVWVQEGTDTKVKVAVKVLKANTGAASNKEILDEAVVMASVNSPYLVRLLCICMAPRVMLVTELMAHGSLLSYLRDRKKAITGDVLLLFGRQIAEGMEYLERKRMIHRDLAARNVLVAEHRVVKITDFGLARLLNVGAATFQHDGGKMPVKWLAPECLQERIFTHQTDVWAFGVTMWELLTFGNAPFKGCKATEIFSILLSGDRLPKPRVASDELYETMLQCWSWEAGMRPTFTDLVERFAGMEANAPHFVVTRADKEGRKFISTKDFEAVAPELGQVDDDGYEHLAATVKITRNRASVISQSSSEYDNFVPPQGNSFPSRDTLPGGHMNVSPAMVAGYDNMPTTGSFANGTLAACPEQSNVYDSPNGPNGLIGSSCVEENPYDNNLITPVVSATGVSAAANPYSNITSPSFVGGGGFPLGSIKSDSKSRLLDPEDEDDDDDPNYSSANMLLAEPSDPYLLPMDPHAAVVIVDNALCPAAYMEPSEALVVKQTATLQRDEENMVMFSANAGHGYENLGDAGAKLS